MSNFKNIQDKIQKFIRKYYTNELIKGILLFISIGFLYFIFTLLVEYFLWLKPIARTILFWLFVLVEIILISVYIVIPLFKLYGLQKGISQLEASKIIGKHFPEVSDKLLNMLQLNNMQYDSDLINASIEQKSSELNLIPFKKAVNFKGNLKYVKYVFVPFIIWFVIYLSGNLQLFNDSFSRVVHHNIAYEAPAPFSIHVLNKSLKVVEGKSFLLEIETSGEVVPDDIKIHFNNENYYLDNKNIGQFSYEFSNISKPIKFYIVANEVTSREYILEVVPTPNIINLKMVLEYPKYTGKQNEVIQNTGNAIVPQGTLITWQTDTNQTDSVAFISGEKKISFNQVNKSYYSLSNRIFRNTNYRITASNSELKNYEDLHFEIDVIVDEFPKIIVNSNIDSISYGPVHFMGQLSDDYGINKLELVYYDKMSPEKQNKHKINIVNTTYTDFYYVFPDDIAITEGVNYEMYFQVVDNDRNSGGKRTKSQVFSYYNKTKKELNEGLLKEQKDNLDVISNTINKTKKSNAEMKKFQDEIKKKATINWNDTKKLEQFIKRQEQYNNLFKKETNKLQKNLNDQPEDGILKEKKEDLNKRIEEAKKIAVKENLLKELEELSKKIEKGDLVDKIKEIAKKNKQKEKSLERVLELTKRFYVEQKANQIAEKLKDLSKKQDELRNDDAEKNSLEEQKNINKDFEDIKEELKNLDKENESLKRPMKLPNSKDEEKEISEELKNALKELNKEERKEDGGDQNNNAKNNQKSAAKKMKEMADQFESSMASGDGESIDENIEDLRVIVENLIEFSFKQESLLNKFSYANNQDLDYAFNLKEQHVLKEYFEHIDDSIYMLSLRLVKMSESIQKEISDVHFNIDESILNFSDNKINNGVSNQHFTITSVNNLANQLSNLLESMMNAKMSMGKGKGDSQQFSLPDIIKKQGELSKKLEDGIKKEGEKGKEKDGKDSKEKGKKGDKGDGEKGNGKNSGSDNEEMNEELFEIYKEQAKLKELLNDLLGKDKGDSKKGNGDASNKMEELEQLILEKGFSSDVVEKMKELNHELLKLDEAKKEQGDDIERKSNSNLKSFESRSIDRIELEKLYYNYNEILNRQSLPLRGIYKKKVQEYFKVKE
ncbi:DUF4175 family protein [Lutibacter citreus]|uniref:DUF4175 family protein n=1 Tax=Lutibacter citreus TaxID=2138210 RepID=UPI000DBEA54B|nr:DUF4175 family protein [Lutibacter citreus]